MTSESATSLEDPDVKRFKEKSIGSSRQNGVAILVITVLILLVATVGTLMIGRVGLMEQKAVGADIRSEEIYSAAIAGLEAGVNWLKEDASTTGCGANYEYLNWSDADGDGLGEAGDTAQPGTVAVSGTTCSLTVSQPPSLTMNTGTFGQTVTYTALTDVNDTWFRQGPQF
jgi:Tfp pilus assembly protein PilX